MFESGFRSLSAFFQGFCNCLTTLYTLELCDTRRQKALCGVLLSVLGNLGTLLTYILGVFLGWRDLAIVLMTLCAPYILGILVLVPETRPPEKIFFEENTKLHFGDSKSVSMVKIQVRELAIHVSLIGL